MPRRQGYALLIALVVSTAALAAVVAFTGSLLFSGPRAKASAATGPQSTARTPAAPAHSSGLWLATWAAAPVLGAADPNHGQDLVHRTIRNVVHTSVGGNAARVTLSNLFGKQPLLIDNVTVNTRPVTFRGAPSTIVGASRSGWSATPSSSRSPPTPTSSSPCAPPPPAAPSPCTPTATRAPTWRPGRAPGAAPPGATSPPWTCTARPQPGPSSRSATRSPCGTGSTTDANSRWPDVLSDRLNGRYAVVNQGIGGNRILRDGIGQRALDRFERDVLGVTGAKTVIIALGINDVQGFPQEKDPQRITDALRTMAQRAHARGMRVVGATLMPYDGYRSWTPAQNAVRNRVNETIRALRNLRPGPRLRPRHARPGPPGPAAPRLRLR